MILSLIIIIYIYFQLVLITFKKLLANLTFQTLRNPILEIILIILVFFLIIIINSFYVLLFVNYLNNIFKYLHLKVYYSFLRNPKNYYLILKFRNRILIKHTIFFFKFKNYFNLVILILFLLNLKLAILLYFIKELLFLFDFCTDVQAYDILIASSNPGIVLTDSGRKKMCNYKLNMFFSRKKHELLLVDYDYVFTDINYHNKLKQEI